MTKTCYPLEVALSLIWGEGQTEMPIGTTKLYKLHDDGKMAWLSGVILNEGRKVIGKASIDGVPLGCLPESKKPGRPRGDEKRMAVFLAWSLAAAKAGNKFGEADKALVEKGVFKTGCSAEGKVRKIRNDLAVSLGLNLKNDLLAFLNQQPQGEGPPECAIYIEKPTYYATEAGYLQILGAGTLWRECYGEKVLAGEVFKLEFDGLDASKDVELLRGQGGPKIISFFRPGQ